MARRSRPDWRQAADYEWLLDQDRSAWAWEWLRRDPDYVRAALSAIERRLPHSCNEEPAAEVWGLHRFEDPDLDARRAKPMWTAHVWPSVLHAEARSAADHDGFDMLALGRASLVTGTSEHWLEVQDGHALRLDIVAGTLARGPARLWLELRGSSEIEAALSGLCQLAALWRGATLPVGNRLSSAQAARLMRLLRVADALSQGASQRLVALTFVDSSVGQPRWRIEQASARLRAQRLVRNARAMADGGYRRILGGDA